MSLEQEDAAAAAVAVAPRVTLDGMKANIVAQRMTVAQQLRQRAEDLDREAHGLRRLASHIAESIEKDDTAVVAFQSMFSRSLRR